MKITQKKKFHQLTFIPIETNFIFINYKIYN